MTTSNGLLLVDKTSGPTSHDVVAAVRRMLGERRVGHAGTLDPLASGLVVVGVGPSTRLLRFAQGEEKEYRGRLRLGVATDTLDADGTETGRAAVPELSEADLNAAAAGLVGEQAQTPPMYSARKVDGTRLYALARRGVEVAREARPIRVTRFTCAATDDPLEWSFIVACSPGTYVRVLASDLAVALGTLGHLTALRRTRSGAHDVSAAQTIAELEASAVSGTLELSPPAAFVAGLATWRANDETAARLRHGQRVARDDRDVTSPAAVLDEGGALIAVVETRGDQWAPVVVLPATDTR